MPDLYAVKLSNGVEQRRFGERNGGPPTPHLGETFAEEPLALTEPLTAGQAIDWQARTVVTDAGLAEDQLLRRVDGVRAARTSVILNTAPVEVQAAWQEKAREVIRYAALIEQSAAAEAIVVECPWLSGEAASRGISMAEMVEMVRANKAAWDAPLRAIDEAAMTIKAAIRAASSAATKQAAFDSAEWPA